MRKAMKFVLGGLLGLALVAVPNQAQASDDPKPMCDETENYIVCCAVADNKIRSCTVMPV